MARTSKSYRCSAYCNFPSLRCNSVKDSNSTVLHICIITASTNGCTASYLPETNTVLKTMVVLQEQAKHCPLYWRSRRCIVPRWSPNRPSIDKIPSLTSHPCLVWSIATVELHTHDFVFDQLWLHPDHVATTVPQCIPGVRRGLCHSSGASFLRLYWCLHDKCIIVGLFFISVTYVFQSSFPPRFDCLRRSLCSPLVAMIVSHTSFFPHQPGPDASRCK